MNSRNIAVLTAAAVALSACASSQTETETSTGDIASARWTATIAPLSGAMIMDSAMVRDTTMKHEMMGQAIAGSAVLNSAGSAETNATVLVSGAKGGETYPWHVHHGTCDNDQGIFGSAASYTPLTTDASGKGQVTVTLPYATPIQGSYMVNIHHMGKVVACGQLTASGIR